MDGKLKEILVTLAQDTIRSKLNSEIEQSLACCADDATTKYINNNLKVSIISFDREQSRIILQIDLKPVPEEL